MKKLKLLFAILGIPCFAITQNVANRVLEYKPAPGQHINIESVGTPSAAENMPTEVSNIVSLGSFGGYIVLGFENACANEPENPYGIDFTILGNAFDGSSEPGVISVMKDENNNGEPDDTWYEIKGSQHFQPGTKEDYTVTYFNTETRDILWKDNYGKSGTLKANSYNSQDYYPTTEYFASYPQDSVTFKGTLLAPVIDSSNPLQFVTEPLDFGYADVHSVRRGVNLTIPDNPYTAEIEGVGGDPIDISWAVDNEGNYVDLDSIHFVRISTGNLAGLGWLGEISTDVAYVADVEANPEIAGENELLVVYHHDAKIIESKTLQLEAAYFKNGRLKESAFSFTSQNSEVATVNSSGLLEAKNVGEAEILISSNGKTKITTINVVAPDSIEILSDLTSVYVGDTVLLEASIYDNNGDKLNAEIQYHLETPDAGSIMEIDGKNYFLAEEKGEVTLNFLVEGFVVKPVNFKILSKSDVIQVYFTVKTENENLFPLQKIEVGIPDLNVFVENRNIDYSAIEYHSLAHAVISGLQKAGINFKFRDDENSGGELYLYSVEKEGEFTYGWGGKAAPGAFAKAWITHVKSGQYLNNFDEIGVTDGDTITLYHISNISNSWNLTRMISDKDSANVNDEVEITLQQSTCSFSEGIIIETALSPVQNQEIYVNEISYFSNESGKATVLLTISPPFIVYSGNDAVLISKKIITSSPDLVDPDIQIYPNPVDDELIIKGSFMDGVHLYIININGKSIWSKSSYLTSNNIDVQYFNPGVYLLKIVDKSGTKTFKFVKK